MSAVGFYVDLCVSLKHYEIRSINTMIIILFDAVESQFNGQLAVN